MVELANASIVRVNGQAVLAKGARLTPLAIYLSYFEDAIRNAMQFGEALLAKGARLTPQPSTSSSHFLIGTNTLV